MPDFESACNAPDDLDASVRSALQATRSGLLHFPGNFLGLRYGRIASDTCEVSMAPTKQALDAVGAIAMTPIAMGCDLSMSAAARSALGRGIALSTARLQLDLRTPRVDPSELLFRGAMRSVVGPLVGTSCELVARDGGVLATATGYFMVRDARRQPAEQVGCQPWERMRDEVGAARRASEGPHEAIRSFFGATPRPATYDSLHRIEIGRDEHGGASVRMPLGAHVANRSGRVQGGVVAGLLARACSEGAVALDPARSRLVSFDCSFLRASDPAADEMTATSQVRFAGRRLVSLAAEVVDSSGVVVAAGQGLACGAETGTD